MEFWVVTRHGFMICTTTCPVPFTLREIIDDTFERSGIPQAQGNHIMAACAPPYHFTS